MKKEDTVYHCYDERGSHWLEVEGVHYHRSNYEHPVFAPGYIAVTDYYLHGGAVFKLGASIPQNLKRFCSDRATKEVLDIAKEEGDIIGLPQFRSNSRIHYADHKSESSNRPCHREHGYKIAETE